MTQLKRNQGETMRPYVGMNGRLYFNYCLGAEFLCEEAQQIKAGFQAAQHLSSSFTKSNAANT